MNDPAMHARPKTLRNVCDFSPWVENAIKLLIVYSVVMYFLEIDIEKSPDSTHGKRCGYGRKELLHCSLRLSSRYDCELGEATTLTRD